MKKGMGWDLLFNAPTMSFPLNIQSYVDVSSPPCHLSFSRQQIAPQLSAVIKVGGEENHIQIHKTMHWNKQDRDYHNFIKSAGTATQTSTPRSERQLFLRDKDGTHHHHASHVHDSKHSNTSSFLSITRVPSPPILMFCQSER
eukprot:scaffold1740_cov150-Skeletonema_dohrnii-CCMP3373.AAC.3